MKKIGLLLISALALFTACDNAKDTVKMTVASEKRMAMGVAPMEVLQVKEGDATEWSFFYSNIEGFNYEPGYEYVLEVKKEQLEQPTPADASSIKYTLVKEVSKTEKTSENMLEGIKLDYVWTGKVLELSGSDIGKGAAAGKVPVKVVKVAVTALNGDNLPFASGDTIHAELVSDSAQVEVKADLEYVFTAKESHPAHALGVYMLETKVQDLTK